MPRVPISYVQTTKTVLKERTYRRPPPDPFVRNPKIREFLHQPTWSVKSLLPDASVPSQQQQQQQQTPTITARELHHLLRLSALPQPKSTAEESSLLETLQTQLHFVREIQKVDTTGVEPLVSISDETAEAQAENTITLADLREELDAEEKVGRNGRVRRVARGEDVEATKAESWDLFKMAEGKTVGRYFVVRRHKEGKKETESSESGA